MNSRDQTNLFFHPLPLGAVFLMALNDHYLKYRFPGLITGKLSDFLGLFYLPIFLAALILLSSRLLKLASISMGPLLTVGVILFSDLLLVSVKLSPILANEIEMFFAQYLFKIQIMSDPTDLVALTMNIPTYLYLKRYFN